MPTTPPGSSSSSPPASTTPTTSTPPPSTPPTGAILCDCKAAEFGRVCWHADHIANAWRQIPAMRACRFLSSTALIKQGRKAVAMVATYRARCGRPLQDDVLTLVASRSEWRRREIAAGRTQHPAIATLPLAA